MNDYREIRISVIPAPEEATTDLLAYFLGEIGYESFVPNSDGLTAYVKEELFNAEALAAVLGNEIFEGFTLKAENNFVEGRDWNAEWEKNYFKPIVVGDKCVIHSSFHTDIPHAEYDIVIDPKMAFGTGHHATTSLMIDAILKSPLKGKSIIDMGTGTGILAILAAMRGAARVDAVEIDPMAQVNAVENVRLNGHPEINVILGDASALQKLEPADYLLANINRNIITADIASYARALKDGGVMFLSGFYRDDVPVILKAAKPHGLIINGEPETLGDNWCRLSLCKK